MISAYVVIDLEMTGLSAKSDQIIEIGAIKVENQQVVDSMDCIVNCHRKVPERVTELTGITNQMVESGIEKDVAIERLLNFIDGHILVGHNVTFDYSFLKQWAVNHKCPLEAKACDTLKLARVLLPPEQSKTLEALCVYFDVERKNGHRALDDTLQTWQIFQKLMAIAEERGGYETYLEPRPLLYKAKKQTPATARQLQRLKEYRQLHHLTDEVDWENLTRGQASRMMDKYVLEHGR